MSTFVTYEFDNHLNENGTIELKSKLKKIGDCNNSLSLDICHDFGSLKTRINSFKFVHRHFFINILDIKCVKSLPNKTTFMMTSTILNKKSKKYTTNLVEKLLFEIKLIRGLIKSEYVYHFDLKFIRTPLLLQIETNKDYDIPIGNELSNKHVIKFVFRSILQQKYNISFPTDIVILLFEQYIFEENETDKQDLTLLYGTMSLKEIIENSKLSTTRNREKYLNDSEFLEIFKMNKQEFYKLKGWRRKNLKREKGLL